eukprot:scaffold30158_cov185-Skeletonema_marinoi.AAC.2
MLKPQPQPPRNSAPTVDAVTVPSSPLSLGSLVDLQDRIILLAARIAGDGKQDMGRLIIDKICTDAIAQRLLLTNSKAVYHNVDSYPGKLFLEGAEHLRTLNTIGQHTNLEHSADLAPPASEHCDAGGAKMNGGKTYRGIV